MSGQQHETTLRFLAQPSDVNFGGKVHGGMVMKWIDQAGYACAVAWSGAYCVTASVSGIQFVAPILIGELVTVHAQIIHTGRSSMQVAVDVWAENLLTQATRLATSCMMVFVALDNDSARPKPVPAWQPATESEAMQDYVQKVSELSRAMAELVAQRRLQPPTVAMSNGSVDGRSGPAT